MNFFYMCCSVKVTKHLDIHYFLAMQQAPGLGASPRFLMCNEKSIQHRPIISCRCQSTLPTLSDLNNERCTDIGESRK